MLICDIKDCLNFPAAPGVYVVFLKGTPLYIGQSRCFRKRLQGTHRLVFELSGADIVMFTFIGNDKERCLAERSAIRCFKPPLNKTKYKAPDKEYQKRYYLEVTKPKRQFDPKLRFKSANERIAYMQECGLNND